MEHRVWWGQRVRAGGGDSELINRQMSGMTTVKVLWRKILKKSGEGRWLFQYKYKSKAGVCLVRVRKEASAGGALWVESLQTKIRAGRYLGSEDFVFFCRVGLKVNRGFWAEEWYDLTYDFKGSSGCLEEIAGATGGNKEPVWTLLDSFREK